VQGMDDIFKTIINKNGVPRSDEAVPRPQLSHQAEPGKGSR
jgi:hypothetical protein